MNPVPATDDRGAWRWLLLVALVVLGAGYGLRDPWPADEPRFVLVAQQMLAGGDFLFPHRGHELYPDKPPLFFWLLAAARTLVGGWRWSFLLPSLLAALGTLVLVRDLGRRLWSPRAGLWAAIAVLSAFGFVYQAKRAQIDPTLVFLTTLSLYGLCRHLLLGPHWRWFWAGCFAAGLGVIAKGVGFLPLLMLLPYAAMRWRGWNGLAVAAPGARGDAWRWSLGAFAFLGAIALWFAPMLTAALAGADPEHRAYLDNILFKQTATRYADAWHHQQPPWYFVQAIVLYWAPFSLALPWLVRDWAAAWRARDARVWLPLAWALLVVAFFSASPGKREVYILPALPAFALAAAPYLADVFGRSLLAILPPRAAAALARIPLLERIRARHVLFALTVALAAGLLALGAACLLGEPRAEQHFLEARGLGAEANALWWMLAGVGAFALLAALVCRAARAGTAAALLLGALWIGYSFVAYPVLDASSSARALMQRTRALAGPETEVGLVDWKEQHLLQAVGPTEEFGFRAPRALQLQRGVAWLRAAPAQRRLLVQDQADVTCLRLDPEHATFVGVANRRTWWLVGTDALAGECR